MYLEWIAAITGVVGAILLALNCRFSAYGFIFFLASSVSWSISAYVSDQVPLLMNQLGFVAINLLGIRRWLFPAAPPSSTNHVSLRDPI